jgi:hypothetical protein
MSITIKTITKCCENFYKVDNFPICIFPTHWQKLFIHHLLILHFENLRVILFCNLANWLMSIWPFNSPPIPCHFPVQPFPPFLLSFLKLNLKSLLPLLLVAKSINWLWIENGEGLPDSLHFLLPFEIDPIHFNPPPSYFLLPGFFSPANRPPIYWLMCREFANRQSVLFLTSLLYKSFHFYRFWLNSKNFQQ